MGGPASIHQQVISISSDYLGPAAERFIDRQITIHLKKKPEKLTKSDLPTLVEWISLAFALLTNDRLLIEEYTRRLKDLGNHNSDHRAYSR